MNEIHAILFLILALGVSGNKSSVTLLTCHSFLVKNKIPDYLVEPVFIQALSGDGSASKLLFLVGVLAVYLDRTRNVRPTENTELSFPSKMMFLTFLLLLYHPAYVGQFLLLLSLHGKTFLPFTG